MKYQWISNGNSIKRALLHYTENTDRIRGFETFSANCVNIEILSLRLIDLRESSKRFRDLFRNLILSKFFFFFFTEFWSYLNDRREFFSKTKRIPTEIFVKYLNKSVSSLLVYVQTGDINFAHSLSRCGQIRAVMWCKIINFYATFIGLIKFDKHDRNTSCPYRDEQ